MHKNQKVLTLHFLLKNEIFRENSVGVLYQAKKL
jgi:hypothetical protein